MAASALFACGQTNTNTSTADNSAVQTEKITADTSNIDEPSVQIMQLNKDGSTEVYADIDTAAQQL